MDVSILAPLIDYLRTKHEDKTPEELYQLDSIIELIQATDRWKLPGSELRSVSKELRDDKEIVAVKQHPNVLNTFPKRFC
jgi:hypothetical protein